MKTTFKILKYILFSILGFVVIIILWFSFWYFYRNGENEIIIVPNNYQGGIIILFNQETGKEEKYNENNERVYEVPKDGILKTRFKLQDGKYSKTKYFYKNGKELRYLWPSDKVWADTTNTESIYKDSIYIYSASVGGGNIWFLVGKAKEDEINYKKLDEMWKQYSPTD